MKTNKELLREFIVAQTTPSIKESTMSMPILYRFRDRDLTKYDPVVLETYGILDTKVIKPVRREGINSLTGEKMVIDVPEYIQCKLSVEPSKESDFITYLTSHLSTLDIGGFIIGGKGPWTVVFEDGSVFHTQETDIDSILDYAKEHTYDDEYLSELLDDSPNDTMARIRFVGSLEAKYNMSLEEFYSDEVTSEMLKLLGKEIRSEEEIATILHGEKIIP